MRIAQISDLHLTPDGRPLYGSVDTEGAFLAALARVTALAPAANLLLLSGDLANAGDAATYKRLRVALAATGIAYVVLPGNHDARTPLRETFSDQPWESAPLCCQRRECGPGLLLCLDTLVPGEEYGLIGDAQAAWLEVAAQPARPTLLVFHHPPFAVGIPGMDAIRCRGADRLVAWLAGHPEVGGLLCGHVHRFVSTSFAGRPALVAPSPAHQIALQGGPLAYTLEPGGFLLHDWEPGHGLTSHYVPVATAPVTVYAD